MVNSYFYKLVLSQLVLLRWLTRTFLQLVLWSTRTFSLVNSYFSLINSYFFFGQLVLFEKITYDMLCYLIMALFSCALNRDYNNPADSRPIKGQILAILNAVKIDNFQMKNMVVILCINFLFLLGFC